MFSSSCTVYGTPKTLPVNESMPFGKPSSPYGETKIKSEEIREKAETGGTLSLDDLSALISTGEIGKITKNNQEIEKNDKPKRIKKSRKKRSNAKRGKPRSTKKVEKDCIYYCVISMSKTILICRPTVLLM